MVKNPWQLRLFQGGMLLLLGLGFYLPVFHFFLGENPFQPGQSLLDWEFMQDFFLDSWNRKVVWFSFYQAFWSAVLSVLLGFPGAYILSHYHFPGKKLFRIFTYLPFILPSILVVLGMVLFFGNNGWVNRTLMALFSLEEPPVQFLYSLNGIFLAHVFYNFPIAMKTIGDQWERLSPEYVNAARSLGARPGKVFLRILLPLLAPSILSSFILIFLLCLNSFAIILVLGGVKFTTMEVLIYQLARIELDFQGAVSLALLQILLGLGFLFSLFRSVDKRIEQDLHPKIDLLKTIRRGSLSAWICLGWLVFIVIFAFGPLLSIVVDSFRKFEGGQWVYTFHWYRSLFTWEGENPFFYSLWNSLLIGLCSAMLSSLVGLGMTLLIHRKKGWKRKSWEIIALFPLSLSAVVFGVTWYHFFQESIFRQVPLVLVVIFMHAILTFPYWIRVVLPALDAVPPHWLMASQSLGKGTLPYFFLILLPWLKKAFIIGFFFSFALSLGELNSTMMVADESMRTLPLEIYRAIAGYRFSYASAVGVVLLLLSVITFLVVEKLFD